MYQNGAGCPWKGELGDLMKHLSKDGDCKYTTFQCAKKPVQSSQSSVNKKATQKGSLNNAMKKMLQDQ